MWINLLPWAAAKQQRAEKTDQLNKDWNEEERARKEKLSRNCATLIEKKDAQVICLFTHQRYTYSAH